jgi:hypothetical protein
MRGRAGVVAVGRRRASAAHFDFRRRAWLLGPDAGNGPEQSCDNISSSEYIDSSGLDRVAVLALGLAPVVD